jgi:UDP-N-acetylmuramate--alanine ligase
MQSVLNHQDGRDRAILHLGDHGVRELLSRLDPDVRYMGCGCDDDLDGLNASVVGSALRVGPDGSRFVVHQNGTLLGEVHMPQPGHYNAMNALVAATAALSLGIDFESIRAGLGSYAGIENRFTVVDVGPVRVVKDYISHPTGMRRVLAAARSLSDGPITAVFKPYRFTMIHYLGDEYAVAFQDAAHTIITELYTAGEVPIEDVSAPWLVEKIRAAGSPATFVPEMNDLPSYLLEHLKAGQQIIFFGGDDLFQIADEFIGQVRDAS